MNMADDSNGLFRVQADRRFRNRAISQRSDVGSCSTSIRHTRGTSRHSRHSRFAFAHKIHFRIIARNTERRGSDTAIHRDAFRHEDSRASRAAANFRAITIPENVGNYYAICGIQHTRFVECAQNCCCAQLFTRYTGNNRNDKRVAIDHP